MEVRDRRSVEEKTLIALIMIRFKFSDLLAYEDRVKALFWKCGLFINDHSRIIQYFSYLRAIEDARKKSKEEFGSFLGQDKARNYYSQYYVSELREIIDALEETNQDLALMKSKLIDLANGTYLLSEENPEDTKSRNTTFELSLFSFLHKLGANVLLGEPNPDLRVSTNNFTYNIECKRPASPKTLEKNIRKALKQLRKPSVLPGIPAIALSLDKVLLDDELIFHSYDEKSALKGLDRLLFIFSQENKGMLDKICGSEPCIVLYYLSCLSGFESNLPMARATYMIGNVYNFESSLSNKLYVDLKSLSENA